MEDLYLTIGQIIFWDNNGELIKVEVIGVSTILNLIEILPLPEELEVLRLQKWISPDDILLLEEVENATT